MRVVATLESAWARHTFATHLLNAGADLRPSRRCLGTKVVDQPREYTHVNMDQLMKVYDASHPRTGKNKAGDAIILSVNGEKIKPMPNSIVRGTTVIVIRKGEIRS